MATWNTINKPTTIWEKYGTILWSRLTYPWVSSYLPWQESGGVKPETSYNTQTKPTTSYSTISKPN